MTARYAVRRLLQVLPTVVAIVLLGFLLVHIAPGDPVLAVAGENGDAEYYRFMTERFGLDRSLPEQFLTYGARLAQGDLGRSYVQGRPTMEVISERIPATLLLTVSALVISTVGGIVLALLAASRPRGWRDTVVTTGSLVLYAAPVFWIGQLAVLGIALRTGWFPIQGMTTPGRDDGTLARALDVAHHLALPALVLASQEVAAVARLARSGLLDELASDHVRTARAKGLSERKVLLGHALRRALLPVVTVIGGRVGHVLSGAVVVEIVFGWPGLGRLLVSSTQARDIPVLLGIFLVVALTVVVVNVLTDLAYASLDPRIRYS